MDGMDGSRPRDASSTSGTAVPRPYDRPPLHATGPCRCDIHQETPDGSAPGVWALARFLHRNQLPGEKEKNALAARQLLLLVPKGRMTNALCPLDKAFFSFLPAFEAHGAQKRAKAHSPGVLQDDARVSFVVSGFRVRADAGGGSVEFLEAGFEAGDSLAEFGVACSLALDDLWGCFFDEAPVG